MLNLESILPKDKMSHVSILAIHLERYWGTGMLPRGSHDKPHTNQVGIHLGLGHRSKAGIHVHDTGHYFPPKADIRYRFVCIPSQISYPSNTIETDDRGVDHARIETFEGVTERTTILIDFNLEELEGMGG